MERAGTPTVETNGARWVCRGERGADTPTEVGVPGGAGELARALGVPGVVSGLLRARGLGELEAARQFIEPKLSDLPDPATLPGAVEAGDRLASAVRAGRPIVIYGDYDVDGVSASAVMFHVLCALWKMQHGTEGIPGVACYVPHRIEEGYGLNIEALEAIGEGRVREWAAGGAGLGGAGRGPEGPQAPGEVPGAGAIPGAGVLVVTVDCGVTAVAAAERARALGVELIITDHHEFEAGRLPEAVVVHPGLGGTGGLKSACPEGAHAFDWAGALPCGAGVAFFVAWQASRAFVGGGELPRPLKHLMVDMLSLASLGTVADLVPLRGVNRLITRFGLGRIKDVPIAGLRALIEASGLSGKGKAVDAYHVGFLLGPRLNACGRMGHARQAVELLTTATGDRAKELASFLTDENESRKATEREVFASACERIDADGHASPDRRAIVLGDDGWHAGVVGIVASRVVERYHRPAVLLACENGCAKGSGRSVSGVHLQQAFAACAEHLEKFGGHAMAAGLTLSRDRIEPFREALIAVINRQLSPDDLCPTLHYDAPLPAREATLETWHALQKLAPFGQGNPTPRWLLRGVTLVGPPRVMGRQGQHLSLQLRLTDERTGTTVALRAVAFGRGADAATLHDGACIDVLGELSLDEWNGHRGVQVMVKDWRWTPTA